MLLGGNFYLGLLKIILQSFLFYLKKLLKIIFLCPFFEVKNQNEPIAIKIHAPKNFINAVKSLISDNTWEKWDGKIAFFKTNVTFPSFFPLYY